MNQKSPSLDVASDPTTCGRESINSSTSTGADFYPEVIKCLSCCSWPGPSPDTHQVPPSQCCILLCQGVCLYWSKYWTGSKVIAACFVPTLLIQWSPVKRCALIQWWSGLGSLCHQLPLLVVPHHKWQQLKIQLVLPRTCQVAAGWVCLCSWQWCRCLLLSLYAACAPLPSGTSRCRNLVQDGWTPALGRGMILSWWSHWWRHLK